MTNANATTANITFSGTIKDVTRFNSFGFVEETDGARKAILHKSLFIACGFQVESVTAESVFQVEVAKAEKGLKVVRVLALNGQEGHEPAAKAAPAEMPAPKAAEPKKAKQPTLAKRPKKVVPAQAPKVTLASFIDTRQIDRDADTGRELRKICAKNGEFVRYAIFDKDGVLLHSLDVGITHDEAREVMGLRPILHLQLPGHGVATNVPALSQGMAGRKAS